MSDLSPEALAVHEATLVLDAHADIVLPDTAAMYLDPDRRSKVAPDKMRAGGMNAAVMSLAVGPGSRSDRAVAAAVSELDAKLEALHELAADDGVVIASTAAEIRAAAAADQVALIPGFQNFRSLGDDLAGLDRFYEAGARVFALTHLGHNGWADSSRPQFDGRTSTYEPDSEHGGISPLGVEAIARIGELGGLLDVSQLSRPATMQALELATSPVVASHSNVQAICDVRRNLSDTEIDAIGDNGGVIHVSGFLANLLPFSDPDMLAGIQAARAEAGIPIDFDYPYELYWEITDSSIKIKFLETVTGLLGPATVDTMVDHIDYIVDRIGIDHVGIGSDFNHGSGMVEGFDNASESAHLTAALLRRGYDAEAVGKIWSGNFLRTLDLAAGQ